jgi:CII-binding regulator of phage lambda lysogenization HflD
MLPRECNFAGQSHRALDSFWDLVGEISALESAAVGIQTLLAEVSALKTEIGQKLKLKLKLMLMLKLKLKQNDPVLEQLSTDCTELRKEVSTVRVEITAMSPTVTSFESCSYFVQFL